MELRHLRYFVAVAEEENVTRAAARLHVSQPPLSRQIRDLEEELGVDLFEHKAKAVRLTEAGRVFLNEARAVLNRVIEAVQVAKAVSEGQAGEIHVGYAPSLTVEILPQALRNFQESNPGVRVQLHDLSTQEMLRGLREGKLQVALMIQMSKSYPGRIRFEELGRYAVCLAMHPAHPLAQARSVTLKKIVHERLIAYTLADYPEYHGWLFEMFASLEHPPVIAEEHDSSTSLMASVEAGRGVAVVHQGFNCLAGPRLKIRPIRPLLPPLVVVAASKEKARLRAVESFIAGAKEERRR